ncbi:MAG: serine/threonine protein kinase, partial [Bdellovibrionales bacterium]|nr:serine/threonine protein kinase [Bdellovibrionales bacterium]
MDSTQIGTTVRFEPGTLIANRYEVVGRLGAGGMGFVLKAADRKLNGEIVAIKLLNKQVAEENSTVLQRMINEVLIARSLTHPNIVRIHDIGETDDGFTYITMEYVQGQSLAELVASQGTEGLPLPTALKLLCEILEGVGFAHRKGVIHRDLKPANVLITEHGELKIVDFGLARASESDMKLTQTGEAVGTPAFMAPEQFRGGEVDRRTDVYALGIMAYQFVTGSLPFNCRTFFDMALKHINAPLPDFADEAKGIPS